MISPDPTTFDAVARPGLRVPVCLELPLGTRTPIDVFDCLRDGGPAFLLESGKQARFSFVGRSSGGLITVRGDELIASNGSVLQGNPFDHLRSLHPRRAVVRHPLLPAFAGGLVGYLGYDMARHVERLPTFAVDELGLPDACFMPVDAFYQIDHERETIACVRSVLVTDEPAATLYERTVAELLAMRDDLASPSDRRPTPVPASGAPRASLSQEQFETIVERAREYVRAGDIFQVNLSVRFDEPFGDDPLALYRELRAINPAPYMAYMDLPEQAIVSASPELLLSVRAGRLSTRPIAGTRPRGSTPEEDEARALELIDNEKERAEHLMLVDLERNDLGRVARFGSVNVSEFMAIERYSHVIHIVSHVEADLAEGRDTFDAIVACFPGGTITGAPKVRAMEIIEELEPCRRGLYTGSIGWIGYEHDAELNIAIRTIVVSGGQAHVQAGAGIVFDSVARHEYRESVRKAQAGLLALERLRERAMAGQGGGR